VSAEGAAKVPLSVFCQQYHSRMHKAPFCRDGMEEQAALGGSHDNLKGVRRYGILERHGRHGDEAASRGSHHLHQSQILEFGHDPRFEV
jgi:hypothetical protein